MPDPNRPVGFDILDTQTGAVLGRYNSHQEAFAICEELEPTKSPEVRWRYIIEPVRPAHADCPHGCVEGGE